MVKTLTIDRVIKVIEKLRRKSIFELRGKDKQDAKILLNNKKYKKFGLHPYGVIDYRAYYSQKEEHARELCYVFIDIKNATVKNKICEYLIENNIPSFNLAGDMDIVAVILSTPEGVEKFKKDITTKYPQPTKKQFEFHKYVARKPLILEKIRVQEHGPNISQQNISINIISRIQANYADDKLKKEYKMLSQEKVLIGHSAIYDFFELNQLRDFALIYNIQNESEFIENPEISKPIIDLYQVSYTFPFTAGAEKDYTEYYSNAQYLAILEFLNPKERDVWEKKVGITFPGSNVFFFPISNFIQQGPYGTTDIEFDDRCDQYSQGEVLHVGNPLRNGEIIDRNVGLNLHIANKNGFVLGKPRMGKTTTARRLIEGFIKENLTIHLINPTLDLVKYIKEDFSDKINEHQILDLIDAKEGFNDFKSGIHIYDFGSEQNDEVRSECIIDAIEQTPLISKKDNPSNCVLIIDEAQDIFAGSSSKKVIHNFSIILQKLSHHGIAMYVIGHQIKDLRKNGESLIPFLENRIFHQMDNDEANEAKDILLHEMKEDSVYSGIEEEITKLPKGRVL